MGKNIHTEFCMKSELKENKTKHAEIGMVVRIFFISGCFFLCLCPPCEYVNQCRPMVSHVRLAKFARGILEKCKNSVEVKNKRGKGLCKIVRWKARFT